MDKMLQSSDGDVTISEWLGMCVQGCCALKMTDSNRPLSLRTASTLSIIQQGFIVLCFKRVLLLCAN